MRAVNSPRSCAAPGSVPISARAAVLARMLDYLELTKPRIAVFALVTVAVGYTLGASGNWQLAGLSHAMVGIALVAAGCSALNQFIERSSDARMRRTSNRPLPCGRLLPAEGLFFGLATGILGTMYLVIWVNTLTAVLAVVTFVFYAAVYTPLKRVTSFCTVIGAIPGALPPVLGWTAGGGQLDAAAFTLFAILFLWQFPHFLAIAWLYRNEYHQAGLQMLPSSRPSARVIGLISMVYALALIPVSLLPMQLTLAGNNYLFGALILGAGYLACSVRFAVAESVRTARELLWSSLIYLPTLLLVLTWDYLQLLH